MMSFWAGWMLRGLVAAQSKPVEPGTPPYPPEPTTLREPIRREPTLVALAFWPFTLAVKLIASVVLLAVMSAVVGAWAWQCILLGQWVMDHMETFAKLYEWQIGERALYVVAPGLLAMALYWTASVLVVGGIRRGLRHVWQRRAARRQVRALLHQAKEKGRGDCH
jgi:hypothetical protein